MRRISMERIARYLRSDVGKRYHRKEWGMPSGMDQNDHACHMAGFATWVEDLEEAGYEVVLP